MSMSDTVADLLTRIRNAQSAGKNVVNVVSSKLKVSIVEILKREGYVSSYQVSEVGGKPSLEVSLKYYLGQPVISQIQRVSRPGLRVYKASAELPQVLNGMGIAVISTSKGLLTDREARAAGVGGEVLCYVS